MACLLAGWVDQAPALLHCDGVSSSELRRMNRAPAAALVAIEGALRSDEEGMAKRQVNRKGRRQSTGGAKMANFQAWTG